MIGAGKEENIMDLIVPGLVIVLYIAIILYSFRKRKKRNEEKKQVSPCEYCLRWEECNGVDAEFCPLIKK